MKHLVNHDETFGKSRMVKNTYTLQEDYNVSKKKKILTCTFWTHFEKLLFSSREVGVIFNIGSYQIAWDFTVCESSKILENQYEF